MKNKKKFVRPRRQKAIRRWIITTFLVLIVCFCSNFGFTVFSALRETEEFYGTGKTELIIPFHGNELIKFTGIGRYCLSYNDEAIISLCAKYNLFIGWYRAVAASVDRTEGAGVDVGSHFISGSKSGNIQYYFGIVNDDRIKEIKIGFDTDYDQISDEYTIHYPIMESDGLRYFYQGFVPEEDGVYLQPTVFCYSDKGELIYEAEIAQGTSSFIG